MHEVQHILPFAKPIEDAQWDDIAAESFWKARERIIEMESRVPARDSHIQEVRDAHEWFATLNCRQEIECLLIAMLHDKAAVAGLYKPDVMRAA